MKRLIFLLALLIMAAQGNAQRGFFVTSSDTAIDDPPDKVDTFVVGGTGGLLADFPEKIAAVKVISPEWGEWQVIGDTVWYYRLAVDTAAISLALDSMFEIPGIWEESPFKTLPVTMRGYDSVVPLYQMFPYWFDPQTGYFHTPDGGVWEARPDSECIGYRDSIITRAAWKTYCGTVCDKWEHFLEWRKVEER